MQYITRTWKTALNGGTSCIKHGAKEFQYASLSYCLGRHDFSGDCITTEGMSRRPQRDAWGKSMTTLSLRPEEAAFWLAGRLARWLLPKSSRSEWSDVNWNGGEEGNKSGTGFWRGWKVWHQLRKDDQRLPRHVNEICTYDTSCLWLSLPCSFIRKTYITLSFRDCLFIVGEFSLGER